MQPLAVLILYIFAIVISFAIIKSAVVSAIRDLAACMRVQNTLLRKTLDIKSTTLEELEDNYAKGYYTLENYKIYKMVFLEEAKKNKLKK